MKNMPSVIARLAALSLVAVLMSSNFVHSQTPKNFAQARREFKTFYDQGMRKHGIIGSSFMLVQDGQVIAQEFFGLANQEKQQAVDENTIYHWASITKTFTAIAIMQLRDRGLLKLEDPIIKYLPELKAVHNPFGQMSDITLKHLMTHSAGFRAATWPWGGDKDWQPHEPRDWSQLVAMMPYTEILFKPGSKFSYSNLGIIFLGRVIELLAGEDYEVYIDKNIFKPLEMYRSYFDATPYHLLKNRSASYWLRDGKLTPARFDADTGITVSNGGLNSPLPDMVKYLTFLTGDVRRQAAFDQVLKRSSLEEMFQPQLNIASNEMVEPQGQNRKDAMGLSFFIEDNFGQHFIGHSGSQNGFISHFYFRPDTRLAYIIAFNTQATAGEKVPEQDTRRLDREIKDYLFQNIFPQFSMKK
ncbi:MAG TPA: serine hydrolase domain-containing protein [Blastocatellia bacterium]|nr:serine hydrolase domain-containing protein [Blastocatellia bacterium]HMV86640.1 serine hydrolase domain-containing protein [Blastocatellia bacterium]HMY76007.1 serine hydrolase domain-containing protein [Blastocatellia bacterium]HMZ20767.1 serine hydrolase domain-containing protein [Blastocatellia bacterium]HNG30783.1 serine hydrolase domain-containing protein [Blastocatellia bacterium]